METLVQRARAYLEQLEADRKAALALSEQKAEEAKLIQARQEGFQAAMEILGGGTAPENVRTASVRITGPGPKHEGNMRRRGRRPIRELILRELSFSGQAMTVGQIARAIDYIVDRTETALERMHKDGQVTRNGEGRWAIDRTALSDMNGQAARTNGNSQHVTRSEQPIGRNENLSC